MEHAAAYLLRNSSASSMRRQMRRLHARQTTQHYSTEEHSETHLQRGQVSVVRHKDLQ
jgi:ribosomal protein L32